MSGIAEVLLDLGYKVSGSDLKESDATGAWRTWAPKFTWATRPRRWKALKWCAFPTRWP